jgi:hypothetical protein
MTLSGPVPQTATPDTPGDLNQAKNRQTIVEFFNEIDPLQTFAKGGFGELRPCHDRRKAWSG